MPIATLRLEYMEKHDNILEEHFALGIIYLSGPKEADPYPSYSGGL
jgi:hypothetical protein